MITDTIFVIAVFSTASVLMVIITIWAVSRSRSIADAYLDDLEETPPKCQVVGCPALADRATMVVLFSVGSGIRGAVALQIVTCNIHHQALDQNYRHQLTQEHSVDLETEEGK